MPSPASFCSFSFSRNFTDLNCRLHWTLYRTRIVRVEGEHADHWSTTSALTTIEILFTGTGLEVAQLLDHPGWEGTI